MDYVTRFDQTQVQPEALFPQPDAIFVFFIEKIKRNHTMLFLLDYFFETKKKTPIFKKVAHTKNTTQKLFRIGIKYTNAYIQRVSR